MNNGQIKSKERVSAHGEVFTAERDRTERKMWGTVQTHRRNELYAQLQQLNKQINELQ